MCIDRRQFHNIRHSRLDIDWAWAYNTTQVTAHTAQHNTRQTGAGLQASLSECRGQSGQGRGVGSLSSQSVRSIVSELPDRPGFERADTAVGERCKPNADECVAVGQCFERVVVEEDSLDRVRVVVVGVVRESPTPQS
jgi:hypothetical protein